METIINISAEDHERRPALEIAALARRDESLQSLWLEWPHLKRASTRLSRLTAGLTLPSAKGEPLLTHCIRAGVQAATSARAEKQDTLAAFVLTVSRTLPEILSYTVSIRSARHNWVYWSPVEDYLLDELKQRRATELRVQAEPHPLHKNTGVRLVLASRVFSMNDLARAGVLYVAKSAA